VTVRSQGSNDVSNGVTGVGSLGELRMCMCRFGRVRRAEKALSWLSVSHWPLVSRYFPSLHCIGTISVLGISA